jgi:hypothetical protein
MSFGDLYDPEEFPHVIPVKFPDITVASIIPTVWCIKKIKENLGLIKNYGIGKKKYLIWYGRYVPRFDHRTVIVGFTIENKDPIPFIEIMPEKTRLKLSPNYAVLPPPIERKFEPIRRMMATLSFRPLFGLQKTKTTSFATDEEFIALELYQANDELEENSVYYRLNTAMRNDTPLNDNDKNIHDNLVSLLKKNRLIEDTTVYRGRGFNKPTPENFERFLRPYKAGDNHIEKQFLSTSLNIDVAIKFKNKVEENSDCCLFEILLPKGTNAVYVPDYIEARGGKLSHEDEVLVLPGGRLEFEEEYKKDGNTIYKFHYVLPGSFAFSKRVKKSIKSKRAKKSIKSKRVKKSIKSKRAKKSQKNIKRL